MFHKTTGMSFSIWPVYYYDKTNAVFIWPNSTTSKYVRSAIVGIPITVDEGSRIYPIGFTYNGYPVYLSVGGYSYLWYDSTNARWVMNGTLGYGTREVDNGVNASPRYTGDSWYTCANLTGTYIPRGSAKNAGSNKTVSLGIIEGWECATIVGVYTVISGAAVTGTKWVGWKVLAEGANEYVETAVLSNGNATFAGTAMSIWYDGTNWILSGSVGAKPTTGYWECSTLEGTYALAWTAPDPQTDPPTEEPTPSTYTVAHKAYREMTGADQRSEACQVAQVAVWL